MKETKTRKAIATYHGGIYSGIDVAIAEGSAIYIRFQDKTPWGWQYGPWLLCGNSNGKIPLTIQVGFSTVRIDHAIQNYRLPKNTDNISKVRITEKDFDCEENKYSE